MEPPRPPYPLPAGDNRPERSGQGFPYAARGTDIEKRYYTIGEVAELLELNPSVLRFWETEFRELSPRKTRKGRRLYSAEDLVLLRQIHTLVRVHKYTLQGAREKLSQLAQERQTAAVARQALQEVKDYLVALRNSL